ncbi:MAG: family N-acetyltransferase [Mucilaginibacter sp.]|nr:family N-acetyltransferase [Mucilaginibacter sp.]
MFTSITIQIVNPSDVDELLSLSKTTFYDAFERLNNPDDFEAYTSVAFTHDRLLSELTNPHSAFYFALIDDKKVGYIKLNYASAQTEFRDENAVEVERIYVLANQQGKRIGKQMIDFAISKAVEAKLQYIWLGVWEHNHSAIRFYEREGFKQFSGHEFWVGNDKQIDLLMKKELV